MRSVRLSLSVLAVLCCSTVSSVAQDRSAVVPQGIAASTAIDRSLNVHEPHPLWPDGAPGALGKTDADIPTVSVYLPPFNPTQTAVVVAPGGGYEHLAMDHEGLQVAQWLNAHGVAAVVLKYRLGPAYHSPIELGDAQRAIRFARSHASQWGVRADRIGMWGFSAGGHLAATAGTKFDGGDAMPDGGNATPQDAMDRVSSRPDFLILAYPVISMEEGVTSHGGSVKNLLGTNPDEAARKLLSADLHVTPQTPPTFLFATTDDATVPVENSVLFYQALVKNHVQAEMHLYRHGRHGLGLAQADPEVSGWTDLLAHWMHENGWMQ